jgi:hypothetical protein
VKGAITNQRYLEQVHNVVILVIQGAGHVKTEFFQQDGAYPCMANVILDVLYNVSGSCLL